MRTALRRARVQDRQLRLLEALGRAMVVTTARGVVYETATFERCLARERLGGRARLERAIVRLVDWMAGRCRRGGPAKPAARPTAVSREVRTSRARYRLRAVRLGPDVLGEEPGAVVVDVEEAGRKPIGAAELRARFSLTPREVEVADLIVRGLSDAAIATRLGISRRTAEHHAAHVRRKLGLSARTAIPALLLAPGRRTGSLA